MTTDTAPFTLEDAQRTLRAAAARARELGNEPDCGALVRAFMKGRAQASEEAVEMLQAITEEGESPA